MKKNYKIHLRLDNELLVKLRKESFELEISLSDLCRQKLRRNTQLTKIEIMVEDLSKKLNLIAEKSER